MPRPPRIDVPGLPQHLYARGHNRTDCFRSELDRTVFLRYLKEELEARACVHAYVQMTNHVHFLVTGHEEGALSRLMQHLGRRYCRYVNRAYDRSGALYEGRFKSSLVESETYFLECMRYIELNPVRAGLVDHPSKYRWSSYAENARGEPRGLITPHQEYLRLGRDGASRAAAYRALVEQPLDLRRVAEIRRTSSKNGVLGSRRFQTALELELRRCVAIAAPGRPCKYQKVI